MQTEEYKTADSIIVFVMIVSIMFFGLTYTAITYTFNVPIKFMNEQVDKQLVSQDTMEHFKGALNLWRMLPLFFLIGLILWCVERAKGGNVYPSTYFEYMLLLIVLPVMSCYAVMSIGLTLDTTLTALQKCEMLTNISYEWGQSMNTQAILIKFEYYLALTPGYLGAILYSIHAIVKQRGNSLVDGDSGEGEMITPYSLQQF